jgi:hypothetical protein
MSAVKAAMVTCVMLLGEACSSNDSAAPAAIGADSGTDSSGGSAGSGGGSGSGGTGGGPLSCAGAFGAPRVVMAAGTSSLSSPALTADELEMFYVSYTAADPTRRVFRTTRASKNDTFSLGSEVPELTALCADPADQAAIDVTADGLRAYVSCAAAFVLGRLEVAQRSSRSASFVAAGNIGTELGASVALDTTELVAYQTAGASDQTTPLVSTRATTADSFAAGVVVPGLTGSNLVAPEPSPDNLLMFGGVNGRRLGVAQRSSAGAPFSAPTDLNIPLFASGAPHVSTDCRRLYFVGIDQPDGSTIQDWGIYVIER